MRRDLPSWSPLPEGFACLHESARGRAVACSAAGRLIVEAGGICLILRPAEARPLLDRFRHTLACPAARTRLERGGTVRVRDAVRGHSADLGLAALADLIHVLEAAVPLPPAERPDPPYQSAIIDNAIAVRAFPSSREAA
jgi:hypothetical protein